MMNYRKQNYQKWRRLDLDAGAFGENPQYRTTILIYKRQTTLFAPKSTTKTKIHLFYATRNLPFI